MMVLTAGFARLSGFDGGAEDCSEGTPGRLRRRRLHTAALQSCEEKCEAPDRGGFAGRPNARTAGSRPWPSRGAGSPSSSDQYAMKPRTAVSTATKYGATGLRAIKTARSGEPRGGPGGGKPNVRSRWATSRRSRRLVRIEDSPPCAAGGRFGDSSKAFGS